MKKIKVGAVSYLNTKPLLYGILHNELLMQQIVLREDYPSRIQQMLIADEIDVGLVPVIAVRELSESYIISDYCIGADGNAASVCLFSDVPLEKIERVLLDYQSKTSVNLAKILLKHHWKINPVLEKTKEPFIQCIKGTTAGVVIGDRALAQRKISKYIYDLAGAWKAMTGLPFVFAAWVANKKLPGEFIKEFNHANEEGLNNLDTVIKNNLIDDYDLNTYYRKNLSYKFDSEKYKAMEKFLSLIE